MSQRTVEDACPYGVKIVTISFDYGDFIAFAQDDSSDCGASRTCAMDDGSDFGGFPPSLRMTACGGGVCESRLRCGNEIYILNNAKRTAGAVLFIVGRGLAPAVVSAMIKAVMGDS